MLPFGTLTTLSRRQKSLENSARNPVNLEKSLKMWLLNIENIYFLFYHSFHSGEWVIMSSYVLIYTVFLVFNAAKISLLLNLLWLVRLKY